MGCHRCRRSAGGPSRRVFAGLLLVGGALLIAITVALPPSAEGSDNAHPRLWSLAAVCGALLLSRRRVNVAVLGLAAALGTAMITLARWEGGHMTGTEDNEVLFLWVSLFAFWFFDLRHAMDPARRDRIADAVLLIDQHPTVADGSRGGRPGHHTARHRAADGLDPALARARTGMRPRTSPSLRSG